MDVFCANRISIDSSSSKHIAVNRDCFLLKSDGCVTLTLTSVLLDLLNNIRTQILVQMLKPYTRVRLAYLADRLNIEQDEVESLLIKCILNKQIHGRLDQIQGLVVLEQAQDMQRFDSLKQWTAQLDILQKHINQKIS
eukprot:TRINITY_DN8442_c0_g1_i5.p2 TRINITY_DN8442_c0_g1~~TRINITY_DN8442_c0_g1_i5.p2  ORF type:complete len:138 (+),score=27.93 TRINITY_DN8442_c0_g1_i5:337-750(+)